MSGNTLCPVCETNWAERGEEYCYDCRMAMPDLDEFSFGENRRGDSA